MGLANAQRTLDYLAALAEFCTRDVGVAYRIRDDCQRKKVDRTPRQASTLTNS
jgi:hypothetical protein